MHDLEQQFPFGKRSPFLIFRPVECVCKYFAKGVTVFSHFPTPRRLTGCLSLGFLSSFALSLSAAAATEISISDEVFYYCLNKQIFPRRKCLEDGGKAPTASDRKIFLCVCKRERGGEIEGRLAHTRLFLHAETITSVSCDLSADGITASLLIARIINEIAPGAGSQLNFNGKRCSLMKAT